MDTGLDLSFISDVQTHDLRVTVEGESGPEHAYSPTLADIDAMLALAKSGLSARTYQMDQCPCASIAADGTLTVNLAALVWPSRPGLAYRLDLPEDARPGAVTVYRAQRRRRIWTNGRQIHELPWRMEQAAYVWHPRLLPRDGHGTPVTAPAVVLDHARVIVAAPVYGLLTVSGTAVGYRHEFALDVAKFDQAGAAQQIDLDAVPVSATWVGADGEEESVEADIALPACVSGLLETCEDGMAVFQFLTKRPAARIVEVAYSSCDGSVLGTRVVREGQT